MGTPVYEKIRIFLLAGLFLGSCIFAAGCSKGESPVKKGQPQEAIPVKAQKVSLMDIEETLDYVGNIKAEDEAVIYPKVGGKIMEKIKKEGDMVNKGDTLLYIDRDEVGLKFEKAAVVSPLSGVVGRVLVDIGENVTPVTPLALVVDMRMVKIGLDIPENYLPRIFIGQEARVSTDAYPQKIFAGKVTEVSPVLNLENRAAPVEIALENADHKLKSGMFARVSLTIAAHPKVPVLLKEAIIGRAPDTYVYVVQDDKATLRKVSLGIRSGPFYEVTEGLKDGELAVVVGQQRLYEGAPVSVELSNGNHGGEAR